MAVHSRNPLIGARLQELAGDDLLHRQHHTVLAPNADSCSAILNRFDRVLNLQGFGQPFLGNRALSVLLFWKSPT